jgi:hypothetical protein
MRTYGTGGRAVAATGSVDLPDPDTTRTPEQAVWARRAAALEAAAPAWTHATPAPAPRPELVTAPAPVPPLAAPAVAVAAVAALARPVRCDVCHLTVAADYVARTGHARHKPCQAKATTAGPDAVREVA